MQILRTVEDKYLQALDYLVAHNVPRPAAVLVAAVIGLGVLTIVIPLMYLISVSVTSGFVTTGFTAGQNSTLTKLVNQGGAALSLTTTAETANRPHVLWARASSFSASTYSALKTHGQSSSSEASKLLTEGKMSRMTRTSGFSFGLP